MFLNRLIYLKNLDLLEEFRVSKKLLLVILDRLYTVILLAATSDHGEVA